MQERLQFIFFISIIFYIVFPGTGALFVRSQWQKFRKKLFSVIKLPLVNFKLASDSQDGYLGKFRFIGQIEALQETDTVWLKSIGLSVKVNLRKSKTYVLRRDISLKQKLRQINWNSILLFPEGMEVLVSGSMYIERGIVNFKSEDSNDPLLILAFDGSRRTMLERTIWESRQRNEYMNPVTPVSMVLGLFSMFLFAYLDLTEYGMGILTFIELSLGLLPVFVFLPPGLLLFRVYRRLWSISRKLRVQRDLIMIPLSLSTNGEYSIKNYTGKPLSSYGKKYPKNIIISKIPLICSKGRKEKMIYGIWDDKKQEFVSSEDPLIPTVITSVNPESSARCCNYASWLLMLLSLVIFYGGLIFNLVLGIQVFRFF